MEDRAALRKYLPILWIVNLAVAAFFAALYLYSTSDILLEGAGERGEGIYTARGGWPQALYRYGMMTLAAFLLQGIMAVLNFGVVPFLEPDEDKVTPTCLKIALGSTVLIMAITVGALAVGWPKP